jgi:hypothetical protein
MSPELALGGLQRWLQAVIAAPGPVKRALRSRDAARLVRPGRARDVVLPSATLSADERVGVYHDMYLPRMLEALESDYPGLAHYLGEPAWERLVRGYVDLHPSRSYSLNELGRRLPEFVRRARVPRPAFCSDLARLEWAVAEVFDAAETKPLGEADFAARSPSEWQRARLVPVPAVRLLSLEWNAFDWLSSFREDSSRRVSAHRHPAIEKRRSFVVVYRRDYAVKRREQDAAAFALLSDLVAGEAVGRAVGRALARRGAARLLGPDAAFRHFRDWASMGLFQAIEPSVGARRPPIESARTAKRRRRASSARPRRGATATARASRRRSRRAAAAGAPSSRRPASRAAP